MDLRELVSGWHTKVVAEQPEPPPASGITPMPAWRIRRSQFSQIARQPWEIKNVTAKRFSSALCGRLAMTVADATLAVFTLFNSVRFLAYLPQIAKAIKDRSGAEAISFGTWALFLASHASAMAYAIENQGDWKMASLFLSNVLGCSVILAIAGWKRSRHRKRSMIE